MFAEWLYRYDCSFGAVGIITCCFDFSMADPVSYAVPCEFADHESRKPVSLENLYSLVNSETRIFCECCYFPVIRYYCYVSVCRLKHYSRVKPVTCT